MGEDLRYAKCATDEPSFSYEIPLGFPLFSLLFKLSDLPLIVTNKYIHIPSPLSLLERSRPSHLVVSRGNGTLERILRNPYALSPILFCLAILGGEMALNVSVLVPSLGSDAS